MFWPERLLSGVTTMAVVVRSFWLCWLAKTRPPRKEAELKPDACFLLRGIERRAWCNIHVCFHNVSFSRHESSALDRWAGSKGSVARCVGDKALPPRKTSKNGQNGPKIYIFSCLGHNVGNPIRVKSNSPESSSNGFIGDATISLASGASSVC